MSTAAPPGALGRSSQLNTVGPGNSATVAGFGPKESGDPCGTGKPARPNDRAAQPPAETRQNWPIVRHEVVRGARWTRKSLQDRPPRLAITTLGGSPASMAVPPILAARASAIRNGAAGTGRRSQTRNVTRGISSTVVTLSSPAEATAVTSARITSTADGRPRPRLAARIATYLKHSGAGQHRHDEHHARQQEDDVPVDPRLAGEERVLSVRRPAGPSAAAPRSTFSVAIST
jgi:hypothetical protein